MKYGYQNPDFKYHGKESHDNATLFRRRMRQRARDAATAGQVRLDPPIVIQVPTVALVPKGKKHAAR